MPRLSPLLVNSDTKFNFTVCYLKQQKCKNVFPVLISDVPHGEVSKFGSVPAQHMYNWVFVCISLIEHTLKMRENDNSRIIK
jgi:hypothetical protein